MVLLFDSLRFLGLVPTVPGGGVWYPAYSGASFLIFVVLFWTARALGCKNAFLASTVTSSIHAIVTVIFTGTTVFSCWGACDLENTNTQYEMNFLAMSLGYFVYDSFLCVFVLRDLEGSLHHAACAIGLVRHIHFTNRTLADI
jgi:hypothetical protein